VRADATRWEEDAHVLLAGLFALHPDSEWPRSERKPWKSNLGDSWRRLANDVESEGPERRFVALINAERDDVGEHLRHAVYLLRDHGIPVDWSQLLRDLLRWDAPDRTVQRRWSRSFWSTSRGPDLPCENIHGTQSLDSE
jgi:CRISPR system Cascade subunit CasB